MLECGKGRGHAVKKILVCEDETSIREFVVINLKRAGYEVVEAGSGEEAVEKYDAEQGGVDIALLDIMLPGMTASPSAGSCASAARPWASSCSPPAPRDGEGGRPGDGGGRLCDQAFQPVGAGGPGGRPLPRVTAVRSRNEVNYLEKIESGAFVLNLRSRTLKKDGQPVELTQVEFQIMEYFFTNPGKALSRTEILTRVWGEEYFGEEKIVDVNIRRLRDEDRGRSLGPQVYPDCLGHGI